MSEKIKNASNISVLVPEHILLGEYALDIDNPLYDGARQRVLGDRVGNYRDTPCIRAVYQELHRAVTAMVWEHDLAPDDAAERYQPIADFFSGRIDTILAGNKLD